MGKGARTRRRQVAAESASAPLLRVGPFFHGGAPGLEIGDLLVSARRLGLRPRYLLPNTPYDPNWVYATTDVGVAEAFAHRNRRGGRRPVPGDVYEVEPGGGAEIDPDYDMFPKVFLRCRQAQIVRVVARGVALTDAEVGQRERSYKVWDSPDRPIWDENGLIHPSDQMLAQGVTREWTTLLRPWLPITDIDGRGRLLGAARAPSAAAAFLEIIPSLDRDHRIHLERDGDGDGNGRGDSPAYRCECGGFADNVWVAAAHQLGETAVAWIARVHDVELTDVIYDLAVTARRQRPARWSWLPHGTPSGAEAAPLPAPGRSQPSRHSRTTPPEPA